MPEGADTVMMQEDCILEHGAVRLKPASAEAPTGAMRRGRGERRCRGGGGNPAQARRSRACRGAGQWRNRVYRPLRAALLSTGDEVSERADRSLPARYTTPIASCSRRCCAVSAASSRPRHPPPIVRARSPIRSLRRRSHDLIVTPAASRPARRTLSGPRSRNWGRLDFWRLAIKPGRPVALGQVGGVPLIGLPGNPVAAALTFAILARPLILRLGGGTPAAPLTFRCRPDFSYRKRAGRREYLRATLAREQGAAVARRFPRDGAGILSSIARSRTGSRSSMKASPDIGRGRRSISCRSRRYSAREAALLRLAAGPHRHAEEDLPLPAGVADVAGLLEWLRGRGGAYAEALRDPSVVRVAVNQEYVGRDHSVRDGDEIAILPPMTGANDDPGVPNRSWLGLTSWTIERNRDLR